MAMLPNHAVCMRTCNLWVLSLLFCVTSPLALRSQDEPAAPPPSDAAELLSQARDRNGLYAPDVKPWHIRAAYTLHNAHGKTDIQGVYEEWWVSNARYKRSFSSPNSAHVEYATESGLFRLGPEEWPSGQEMSLRENLIEPLPGDETVKQFKPELHTQPLAGGTLDCVRLTYPLGPNMTVIGNYFPTACFEAEKPLLRTNSPEGTVVTTYSQIVPFQGHYLAREMHTFTNEKLTMDLRVDVYETLNDLTDPRLNPPADAVRVDLNAISFKWQAEQDWPIQLRRWDPGYPNAIKRKRIQGTVVIEATIGKDGCVSATKATAGPLELRAPAAFAVRHWVFRPVRVLGEPRVVTIEVRIPFTLG